MPVPDVTVVVAVHNAVPHLTACLDSLVVQSLAPGRLEVVVVDDGSTDGGGALLDEYAARHPGLFRVLHRPDSGGPAGPADPADRGLAMARGRFVLFLGVGDRLGPEALERLVAAADAESVGCTDPASARAPAGIEPLRLDIVRCHGLLGDEGLQSLPDHPLAPEACPRAGRGPVLSDCDCYFLVLREDRGNATGRASVLDRLRGIAALQQVADELVEPGEELDAIRVRSFTWDVPRLLQAGFLLLDDGLQRRVCAEVGRLVERFGVREVYHRLPVSERLRLELAVAGRPEVLRDQIRYEAAHGEPPVVVDGRRHYAGYPAFRDARLGLPDELFLLREEPPFEATPPLNLAQQLWRGVVPEQVRRGLRRHPGWRRLANSVNGGRG
ncbi:glycosyltransferase [Kitasatospora sp. NPDC101157]|uniref:glycosyltransferase n=1 Tax=Kitasatospora sp. NPDC101157 TaxID=3364098 RepID=UPI0038063003